MVSLCNSKVTDRIDTGFSNSMVLMKKKQQKEYSVKKEDHLIFCPSPALPYVRLS